MGLSDIRRSLQSTAYHCIRHHTHMHKSPVRHGSFRAHTGLKHTRRTLQNQAIFYEMMILTIRSRWISGVTTVLHELSMLGISSYRVGRCTSAQCRSHSLPNHHQTNVHKQTHSVLHSASSTSSCLYHRTRSMMHDMPHKPTQKTLDMNMPLRCGTDQRSNLCACSHCKIYMAIIQRHYVYKILKNI